MKPITSVDQITPAWLTQILRQRGHLNQGYVISVAAQGNHSTATEGPGFQRRNRIEIQYSSDVTPSAPHRLYLKAQDGALHQDAGEREVAFYLSAAAQMPYSPAPVCFDAAYDSDSGAYHLLLEDISETHRTVHPEEPATRSDMNKMLDALARLHAHWWGHPQLGQSIGTIPAPEEIRASFIRLGNVFPEYVDYLGDRLSVERRRVYEKVLDKYSDVLISRLAQHKTLTLVHDDAHAGNFLLPRQATGQRVYLIDWQQWGVHVGLHDVAYLIALFWYPERRTQMEQSAVQGYHDRLGEYGVVGFDWQTCWDDYRLQVIENLLVPFWAWIFQGEHWGFHRWHQLEKAMMAFQDLKCVEFLE
ncbi:MAG: aminoglycoside phosphotransferase family protein [Anaerolineales bacterium]|nr:aminoglycoside phosphotransferase family protein [Anaerolineales bacterium]